MDRNNETWVGTGLYYICSVVELDNATAISIETFKQQVFLWEFIITALVFGSAFFVLKAYNNKDALSRKNNKKFNTGVKEQRK